MTDQTELPVGHSELRANRLTLTLALAGLVGGLLGFGLGEIQMTDRWPGIRFFSENLKLGTAVWFALVILGIGTALVAAQGLSERNFSKAGYTVLRALPAIVVGGFISGFIAQAVYSSMLEESGSVVVPRAIGWMIAGGLGGVALGIGFRSKKRIQNGLIGGAAGGLVGGLLFDWIGDLTGGSRPSRLIAIVVIGVLMGALIALVDTLRTEMWLTVSSGEMTGRQFILYDESTIVGCARNVPVTILADRTVAEHHIRIDRTGAGTSFECMHNAPPIIVNGNQTTSGRLANGDVIKIGNTELQIGERKTSAPSPGQTPTTPTAPSSTGRPDIYSDQSASPPPQPQRPTAAPPRQRPTVQMKPKEDG